MGEGEVGVKNLTGPLKVLLLLLSILVILIPAVWWCVESDTRIDTLESKHSRHELENKEQFTDVGSDIESLEDSVISLEKREIERIGEYKALDSKLDRLEATQQLILAELRGWDAKTGDNKNGL
jgi:hypothetical protein